MPETHHPTNSIRDFTPAALPKVPDLTGMQKTSYGRFTETNGMLGKLLDNTISVNGKGMSYASFEVKAATTTAEECIRFGRTYAGMLHIRITGSSGNELVSEGIPLPQMTDRGTFIIDGTEKVVVGCLQALEDCRENDLATRRLLLVGEQLEQAIAAVVAQDVADLKSNAQPAFPRVAKAIDGFFTHSRYVKKADLRNPLTLASQLRLVVQKGVTREPGYTARCPHPTHFGRLDLLETPEGDRIGINLTTALFASQDEDGNLLTPFAESACQENSIQLAPEMDSEYTIGDLGNETTKTRYAGGILARVGDDLHCVDEAAVDLEPVHPLQPLGVSSALIPFIAHDDANRALMGANMQKQAMPLTSPDAPLVQTGLEKRVAQEMGATENWCSDNGTLALGRNLLAAFMCWEGYNYEDGIVVSDDVTKRGLLDTTQTREYTVTIRETDDEKLTPEGVIAEGVTVSGGDVLVGKVQIGADGDSQDTSIRVPHGFSGTVATCEHYQASRGEPVPEGVTDFIRIRLESPRPLQIGDKLCTRHGAKGVVTKVVPAEDMPQLPDGRRVQVLMNPLGVPSRMNIGIILETHMGLAAHDLGCTVITPGFWGASVDNIESLLEEAGLPTSGMFRLRDGRTGRLFDQETTVGYLYMLRLDHMVADRRQERATGPYDPETCQPVSGRRNGGGQHVGIMETWALQGHRASHILQEMLTLKSDDITARDEVYNALVAGTPLPNPVMPESVKRLTAQLRGLCLDLQLHDGSGTLMDVQSPNTAISAAKSATLRFADPATILKWSAGEVCRPEQIGDRTGHITLAAPVGHPWRTFVPAKAGDVPQIDVLPVLPPQIRGGNRLDAAYAAVIDANSKCRESASNPETTAELQEAVDNLLNRMTCLLYGKKGWITSALSGKTVDYSARSVICPGPDLDYDTCGLPLAIASTLFEPFVVGCLLRAGTAKDISEARTLLQSHAPAALDALRTVMADKYVLLHRAPTLHRPGIQAFRPILVEGDIIRIHPLTTIAFNADFDGDEMDIYLPLSPEAQREAKELVASSLCQLSPANGNMMAGMSQDMVLGCYYATCGKVAEVSTGQFQSADALEEAYEKNTVGIHTTIRFRDRTTTVGEALFNATLPDDMGWVDGPVGKPELWALQSQVWHSKGAESATRVADALMRFGFRQATRSGLSFGKDILKQVSSYDKRLNAGWKRARRLIAEADGKTNHESACSELAAHWMAVTRGMADAALRELAADQHGLNPLHLMLASRARGNQMQAQQHIAMRGLMSRPDSRIMRSPITTSFLKGHTPFEYLASTYGARRGLADTALKTAEVGTLFKRIMGAVQDVVVTCPDCGTSAGLVKTAVKKDSGEWYPLAERVTGRTLAEDIRRPGSKDPLFSAGHVLSKQDTATILSLGIDEVIVRSPITCDATEGVCAACMGFDLAAWRLPDVGQPVGVVAAQSIGEPGTQLTMRTFHVAMPPKCEPETQRSVRRDILGGLPGLRQLLEAWTPRGLEDDIERSTVEGMLMDNGSGTAAEYLLRELQQVYRFQGVRIDDRHFEIVLKQMLRDGLRGVSQVAAESDDFLASGSAYGGIPALARSAANATEIGLDSVRATTAFGRLLPYGDRA